VCEGHCKDCCCVCSGVRCLDRWGSKARAKAVLRSWLQSSSHFSGPDLKRRAHETKLEGSNDKCLLFGSTVPFASGFWSGFAPDNMGRGQHRLPGAVMG
jgi:hypothetical protein